MPFGTVQLNDGNKMPVIAFGTGSKWKGQDVTDYVSEAIEAGFSHLDTAQFYRNEDSVGAAIRQTGLSRSELFVTTKWSGLTSIRDAVESSLAQLDLKQVDLYLIHNPAFIKDLEKDWKEFERIREDGLSRSIGVSNFDITLLRNLLQTAHIKPAVNQILLHPYNYAENKELLQYCAEQGIVVEAYSSLTPITRYPGGPVVKALRGPARRLGASPVQILLSWVKAKGAVIVTTSSTREHMDEYLAVGDLPDLTDDEIAAIDAAGAKGLPSYQMGDRLCIFFLCFQVICLLLLLHVCGWIHVPFFA
ncbi:Aldo/keto reductase [Fomitopsis serialis]|uniref:Aldo/keto reductase n=1 Tax=Fomitopsis serialis TaxID=139415 RepID=UPI0020080820|nr:Aldo/keto reductase [Neoantrodia serialis]KAH9936088.1 Aldo/keto reductase [Neoantrodia serialis]